MTKNRAEKIRKQFAKQHVVVVGDLILNHYLWGVTERVSPESPMPVVNIESETYNLGGAALVASRLRTFGAQVQLVGAVGDDPNADRLMDILMREDIDVSGVIVDQSRLTECRMHVMGHTRYFQYQKMLCLDHQRAVSLDAIDYQLIDVFAQTKNPNAIIVSDLEGLVNKRLMDMVRETMYKKKIPVIVDAHGQDFKKYRGVTAVSTNQWDVLNALGQSDINDERLMDTGHRIVKQFGFRQFYIQYKKNRVLLFEPKKQVTQISMPVPQEDIARQEFNNVAVYALSLLSRVTPIDVVQVSNLCDEILLGKGS